MILWNLLFVNFYYYFLKLFICFPVTDITFCWVAGPEDHVKDHLRMDDWALLGFRIVYRCVLLSCNFWLCLTSRSLYTYAFSLNNSNTTMSLILIFPCLIQKEIEGKSPCRCWDPQSELSGRSLCVLIEKKQFHKQFLMKT